MELKRNHQSYKSAILGAFVGNSTLTIVNFCFLLDILTNMNVEIYSIQIVRKGILVAVIYSLSLIIFFKMKSLSKCKIGILFTCIILIMSRIYLKALDASIQCFIGIAVLFFLIYKYRETNNINREDIAIIVVLSIYLYIILLVDIELMSIAWSTVLAPYAVLFPVFFLAGVIDYFKQLFERKKAGIIYVRSKRAIALDVLSFHTFFLGSYWLVLQFYIS